MILRTSSTISSCKRNSFRREEWSSASLLDRCADDDADEYTENASIAVKYESKLCFMKLRQFRVTLRLPGRLSSASNYACECFRFNEYKAFIIFMQFNDIFTHSSLRFFWFFTYALVLFGSYYPDWLLLFPQAAFAPEPDDYYYYYYCYYCFKDDAPPNVSIS